MSVKYLQAGSSGGGLSMAQESCGSMRSYRPPRNGVDVTKVAGGQICVPTVCSWFAELISGDD